MLAGHNEAGNMIVALKFEAAECTCLQRGKFTTWREYPVAKGELFHIEVKPSDSGSITRIAEADVNFSAVNHNNKTKMARITSVLHPMRGDGGLHCAFKQKSSRAVFAGCIEAVPRLH